MSLFFTFLTFEPIVLQVSERLNLASSGGKDQEDDEYECQVCNANLFVSLVRRLAMMIMIMVMVRMMIKITLLNMITIMMTMMIVKNMKQTSLCPLGEFATCFFYRSVYE